MKIAVFLAATLGSLSLLKGEPLAEGTYVDLIVVPVGPIALAEFESSAPPPAAGGESQKPGAPATSKAPAGGGGGGGGSGIRVKQQDPSELPPTALYIRQGGTKYFQIPCSQNSVNSPVRTPISDSDVVFYQRIGDTGSNFKELGKTKITKGDTRLLVLLSKPLKEKRWDKPTVSFFPMQKSTRPQLVFVNGSEELQCGVKVATAVKAVPSLKPLIWEYPGADAKAGVDIALAMMDLKGASLPQFYQSNVELKPGTTTLFIPYGVTPDESARCGKLATGVFESTDIRTASTYDAGK